MSNSLRLTSSKSKWFVFYTRTNAEKKCHERLKQFGITSFLPVYVSYNQWSDRRKRVERPLFSNYLFAKVDETERLQVLQVDGIMKCVKLGSTFATISEEEIEQLRITQVNPDRLSAWQYMMPCSGDQVTVMKGPMLGLKGRVLDSRGCRYIVVCIDSLRQSIRVQMPADWVVRAASFAAMPV